MSAGRLVVAMSGGVDSSVAAALLVEAGHEVIGLSMKTHRQLSGANRACCTPDDMRDARRVADLLDIPFYVLDYSDLFAREVVAPFARDYARGQTPNPCVGCNSRVKLGPLWQRAQLMGATALATGHYARHVQGRLFRAQDRDKDQTYFLHRLAPDQLAALVFPLGTLTKAEVRAHARRLGLPVADKAESQEICFVGRAGYAATVAATLAAEGGAAPPPGEVVDAQGQVVGRHAGVHHFTRGQRRGLGLAATAPLYVTHVDAARARVMVGPAASLIGEELWVDDVTWLAGRPPAGAALPLAVQQRHRAAAHPATLFPLAGQRARVRLDAPAALAAPGQAAVFYRGDEVLGGGRICAVGPAAAASSPPSAGGSGPP